MPMTSTAANAEFVSNGLTEVRFNKRAQKLKIVEKNFVIETLYG